MNCEYGNHEVTDTLYCYSDPENGLANDVQICKECLFDHVRFYYPGCANERHLLGLYPELETRPLELPQMHRMATLAHEYLELVDAIELDE